MRFRSFGRTGWQVSEIGFGAWQIGGDWGKVDDTHSIDTLLYAFDKGVNFVDTAELYGNGHSEEVVGKALKQWKGSKIYVASKTRPIIWPDPNDDNPQMRGRFPEWYLRDNIEKSLKRLQVERIDLFQLHSFMPSATVELDWLETLMKLRHEGKIDRIGVSLRDNRPEEGVDLVAAGLVDSSTCLNSARRATFSTKVSAPKPASSPACRSIPAPSSDIGPRTATPALSRVLSPSTCSVANVLQRRWRGSKN
jgi:aryl-alcohol dehydrogenase-like predicted oxidoreductase